MLPKGFLFLRLFVGTKSPVAQTGPRTPLVTEDDLELQVLLPAPLTFRGYKCLTPAPSFL